MERMDIEGGHQQSLDSRVRAHVVVRGVVQGVGFRPFVHRVAQKHALAGWVLNSTEGVEIEVEGPASRVDAFLSALSTDAPPLASVDHIEVCGLPPVGYVSFSILASNEAGRGTPLVSADVATCPDCLAELFDVRDRRHGYPLINCTNCGPRFTIVEGVPYDRPRTTMKAFVMCGECLLEYGDPANRRFHAQPNACPRCGPSIWLQRSDLTTETRPSLVSSLNEGRTRRHGDVEGICGRGLQPAPGPIEEARSLLRSGRIVAVKGLGGFHLACDATDSNAVRRLRERKRRVEKPFAIMVRDLATVEQLCFVSGAEAGLLTSARRPILLLDRRQGSPVAPEVAPGNKRLGVMLPYAPIHHLLLEATEEARLHVLVMTSGNLAEEPISKDNDEALSRLGSLADAFLLHDRPIHVRCDDSVTQVFDGEETVVRRSRGYAPLPVAVEWELEPVLACGAQLKNTFCVTSGSYAFLSQHIGDLDNQEALDFFAESVDHFIRIFDLSPRIVAHDLHPDYLSTRYALSRPDRRLHKDKILVGCGPHPSPLPAPIHSLRRDVSGPEGEGTNGQRSKTWGWLCRGSEVLDSRGAPSPALLAVQHHHAHIASCMAENGLTQRVIGVAFDGAGYGTDGTVWGGEFLVADYHDFVRVAHLKQVPMPGGEAAIRKPYRMALSHLLTAFGGDLPDVDFVKALDPLEVELVRRQVSRRVNSPMTSSCGRLFDAVAALLGVRGEITYEGQAAIDLEMLADPAVSEGYQFGEVQQRPLEIDSSPVIRSLATDLRRGVDPAILAARFHNGVAQMIVRVCDVVRRATGLEGVCLSGGVFQNRFLTRRALAGLRGAGFTVYTHHLVPCNDGGISLGQALVASERRKELHNVPGHSRADR
ncbi:MAG: carbamoyltransferase HypF [Chloroflexi bacterium]|nr:carbamoyltransferase HypF [Chloroflexota bacterium]